MKHLVPPTEDSICQGALGQVGHLDHWQFQPGAQRSVLSECCFFILFVASFPGSPPTKVSLGMRLYFISTTHFKLWNSLHKWQRTAVI